MDRMHNAPRRRERTNSALVLALLALGGCATDGMIAGACGDSGLGATTADGKPVGYASPAVEDCVRRLQATRAAERQSFADGFARGLSAPRVTCSRGYCWRAGDWR